MTPKDRIRQAIEWLASEQHPDAICSHHGIGCDKPLVINKEPFHVRCVPAGFMGCPVLVFDLVHRYSGGDERAMGAAAVKAIRKAVESVVPVVDAWNGAKCSTYSLSIRTPVSPSVQRMCGSNYDGGAVCGCGNRRASPVFHNCEYRRKRYALAKAPEGWS